MRPVRKKEGNRLTAIMQVRNEENRFLEKVLQSLTDVVDDMVIVDDNSTDRTVELCKSFSKVKEVVELKESSFHEEWVLRSRLWKEVCKYEPDWILSIDADEMFEENVQEEIRSLINQDQFDWVAFRMYDFWGSTTHYREDEHWNLHKRHSKMLVRHLPGFPYYYLQQEHHVHRIPFSYNALWGSLSDVRVKHFGWAGSMDERRKKYERYKQIDPEGKWGSLVQYESILDPNPNLVEWRNRE
ncbi:glycosyltransferase [Fictibacillus phosphorivorans]|uniref:glycosyltransferase n=1 Tax=Fictibacillus phosphorivorans TaxID=1221500 RepID=UPI0021B4220D|nr:glycosyltransferase [Fictibacillus phosphorivorans]